MSGAHQVNFKFQSELDIGGRETYQTLIEDLGFFSFCLTFFDCLICNALI